MTCKQNVCRCEVIKYHIEHKADTAWGRVHVLVFMHMYIIGNLYSGHTHKGCNTILAYLTVEL